MIPGHLMMQLTILLLLLVLYKCISQQEKHKKFFLRLTTVQLNAFFSCSSITVSTAKIELIPNMVLNIMTTPLQILFRTVLLLSKSNLHYWYIQERKKKWKNEKSQYISLKNNIVVVVVVVVLWIGVPAIFGHCTSFLIIGGKLSVVNCKKQLSK